MPAREQNHKNKAGPTASPILLVPYFCTLNKMIRQATEIITTSSAESKSEEKIQATIQMITT